MTRREFIQACATAAAAASVSVAPSSAQAQFQSSPTWMDCQSWWQGTGEPVPSHFHISADWPLRQVISGTVSLELQLESFSQPEGTVWTAIEILIDQNLRIPRTNITPPDFPWDVGVEPGGHVTRTVQVAFSTLHPTPSKRKDGWSLLKMFGKMQRPDGVGLILATRLPVYVQNGYPVDATVGKNWGGGAGWADDGIQSHQYPTAKLYEESEAAMKNGVPSLWQPAVGVESSHTPLSRMRVCIDPHFHDLSPAFPEGDPGLVVYDGAPVAKKVLSVNTDGLSSGVHRLFIQAIETAFSTGSSAGVAVYRFLVP